MCRSERDQAEDGTHGGFGAGQDTEQAAGDPAWRFAFHGAGDHAGQQRDDGAGQQGVSGEDAAVAGHDPVGHDRYGCPCCAESQSIAAPGSGGEDREDGDVSSPAGAGSEPGRDASDVDACDGCDACRQLPRWLPGLPKGRLCGVWSRARPR